ncbi:DNA packaging FI family protein [Escherichia coli O40:H32]|nr:DNA packaging FI family protein [Escherichia coli O40:H32]
MTKDELIARLRSLGEQLNRDVSLTGTKEELALRVAELEEELDDTDDAAGQDTSVSPENALKGVAAGKVNIPVVSGNGELAAVRRSGR